MTENYNNIIKKIQAPTREQFESFYRLGKILNSSHFEDSVINEVLDLIIEVTGAERGLFVKAFDPESFSIIAARNIQKENITDLSEFSSGILKEVFSQGKPVLYHDAQQQPELSNFESIRIRGIKSIIGVPVFRDDKIWGVFIADSLKQREKFTDQNLIHLDLFSSLLSLTLDRIAEYDKLEKENTELQNRLEETEPLPEMIGESKVMKDFFRILRRVADTDATILITGESGTGKDLAARAVHTLSRRRENVFLAQFCGSIPDNLLESELFGYKRGAFTGANSDKKGLLEIADKGTFFLDEIADISMALQTKLLRVLENQEIMRLGDTGVKKIDVRIITATNKNLQEMVKDDTFRSDLYYRLNVFPVKIPPLRERKGDVPLLANYFAGKFSDGKARLTPGSIKKLESYSWPGNVRQLINIIQRAVILSGPGELKEDFIIFDEDENDELNFNGTLAEIEKQALIKRLKDFDGNKSLVAKSLGVSRKWVYLKLEDMEKQKG